MKVKLISSGFIYFFLLLSELNMGKSGFRGVLLYEGSYIHRRMLKDLS